MNGWLAPFYSGHFGSMAAGDDSISSYRSARMRGCKTGRDAGVLSAESSICIGDGGTYGSTQCLTKVEGPI